MTIVPTPIPSPSPATKVIVGGTAATGKPLAGATVTLKDSNGKTLTTTAGSDGSYSFNVAGLTPPFLIEATSGSQTFFSIAFGQGTANVTPLSDAILTALFQSEGTSSSAVFGNPSSSNLPSSGSVQTVAQVLVNSLNALLTAQGLSTSTFNPITTPFTANGSGFDGALDQITEPASGTLQTVSGTVTTTIQLTGQSNSVTTTTTTSNSSTGATTSNSTTTAVGAGSAGTFLTNALQDVNALLGQFASTVNTQGSNLQASNLTGLFSSSFLNQGENTTQYLQQIVKIAGNTITVQIQNVVSFDATNNLITVIYTISTSNGLSESQTMTFQIQSNGTALFFGDQSLFNTTNLVQFQNERDIVNTVDDGYHARVNVNFDAPQGQVGSVFVTDPTGVFFGQNTPVPKSNLVTTVNGVANDQFFRDSYGGNNSASSPNPGPALPPVGTVFVVTINPVSGSAIVVNVPVQVTTTDQIGGFMLSTANGTALVNSSGPTAANSITGVVGQTLNATWTLPTTFTIAQVQLNAGLTSANAEQFISASNITTTSTSGSLQIPTQILNPNSNQMENVIQVDVQVEVMGTHGENVDITDQVQ